jgi:uncharacterized protein (TIGR00730 family)
MPDDAQSARIRAILSSPSYRLAEDDPAFMEGDSARPARLALEFMRAELYLRAHGISSTVVVFGGSRIKSPEAASARLALLQAQNALPAELRRADRDLKMSRYYDEARRFGTTVSHLSRRDDGRRLAVVTGGGPGIMEAANRGAFEAGAPSIGFNIRLPTEQLPNEYITPELALRFHYFALRKMHFLLRARALVAFPGGFGTLDELFEALSLVQTHEIEPIPIVLVGVEHWRRTVDLDYLVEQGCIDEPDRHLVSVVETGEEAADLVLRAFDASEAAAVSSVSGVENSAGSTSQLAE